MNTPNEIQTFRTLCLVYTLMLILMLTLNLILPYPTATGRILPGSCSWISMVRRVSIMVRVKVRVAHAAGESILCRDGW